MHLTSVRIENFRGLRDVQVDLDSETILIGENNSGKTAFLEALKISLQGLRSKRSQVFDTYDFHLPDASADPISAGPIRLTLTFAEREPGEWSAELVQELAGLFQVDEKDRNSVTFRVEAAVGATSGGDEIQVDWFFLDLEGNHLTTQEARHPRSLGVLQGCSPVFYLTALRDAGSHFSERGRFWRPFLRNDAIAPERKTEIEEAIQAINELIVASHESFGDVRDRLQKVRDVVATGVGNVSIDAVPPRIFDMLTRSQVSLTAPGGARIPLARHGEGTQSLAVLLLFAAFLEARIPDAGLDAVTEPILALEEPEAHLHPNAIRSLFRSVGAFRGQKIIATHSGDLLSEVDILKVRRFCRTDAGIQVYRLRDGSLDPNELRKFNYHVRRSRGELLFARCWLLVEGETDVTIVGEVARILGHDLEARGVRCVEISQIDVTPLVKAANDLGIGWHLLVDGDIAGEEYREKAIDYLGGAEERDLVTILPDSNIEIFLARNGFGDVYLNNISAQEKNKLVQSGQWPAESDRGYWGAVIRALPRRKKTSMPLQVVQEMEARGVDAVPDLLGETLKKAIHLAQR
jgi:putative ATP-dependent endonuclease of the OLD family